MPTPRDLDPKFKDEKPETVPAGDDLKSDALLRQEDQEERTEKSAEKQDDDTPMIVHRQRVMNPDGTPGEKVHGPMPVADWPEYEKENKL